MSVGENAAMPDGTRERAVHDRPEKTAWLGAFNSVLAVRGLACAATLAGIMVMGRYLGPARYGELVLLLVLMKVASELIGPALDTGLVRFAARAGLGDSDESLAYVRATLWFKLALGGMLLAAGVFLAKPFHALLFGDASDIPAYAVTIAFAGAALTVLWAFAQSCFQARQQFGRYAGFELAMALVRLGLIVLVVMLARRLGWRPVSCIVLLIGAYAIAVAVTAGAASTRLPKGLLSTPAGLGAPARELLGFTKWVFAACCFTSLAHRMDIFLVNYIQLPKEAIGDYSGAVQLVLLGDLVILTLFNVLLPKASGLKTRAGMAAFLRGFRVPAVVACVAVIPVILLSGPIVWLTLGPEYALTAKLFSILVLGTLFSMGCAPAGTVLYGTGNSRAVALLEGLKLIGVVVIGIPMARAHGVFGMAWTLAAIKSTIGIATVFTAHRAISRMREDELAPVGS